VWHVGRNASGRIAAPDAERRPAMGAPPGAPGATPATAIPHVHDDADDSASNMADADNEADGDAMDVDVATVVGAAQAGDGTEETPRVEATPRVRNAGLPPVRFSLLMC